MRELLLHISLSGLLLLLELWLLLLLHLLESSKFLLMKDLLLGDVVLHILLSNINIWLSELVFLVLLHLQLLHSLELIELEFTSDWLRVPLPSSLVPRIAPLVVHVVPCQVACIIFFHFESPILHDIILALDELIPQILNNRVGTLINDRSSDRLQGIAINLDSFDRFMHAQQVGNTLQVIVDEVY